MNIFVGNLAFAATQNDLKAMFANFGKVESAAVVMEKKGAKSRGFGFVEMPDEDEARRAIEALNGKELLGRPVNVMPALSKGAPPANAAPLPATGERNKRFNKYKQGRRSLSYLRKRGQKAFAPEPRKPKSNPLRWVKKRPWKKFEDKERLDPAKKFRKPFRKISSRPGRKDLKH